jgi:hypothetical protein
MKNLRLGDREKGSEFCRFERDLIFNEENKDVGYVRHLDGRSFKLVKSKFTPIDSGRTYLLPEDGSFSVEEGSFIRVEVDKLFQDRKMDPGFSGDSTIGTSTVYAEVGNITEPKIPLPPPDLPLEEFLARISRGWKDPEEDHLNHVMGLLMVSSPRSILGDGGLGSEGIQRERGTMKGTNKDLADSMISQLPVEFRTTGTSQYKYSKVENLGDIKLIRTKRIGENCYSLVPDRIYEAMVQRNIPIQLPFVIRNSSLSRTDLEVDLDVLDYQLTGLYMPPPPEKVQEERFHRVLNGLKNEEFWDIRGVGELDRNCGLKIELALTRLFIGKRFVKDGYRSSRTGIEEGVDLIKRIMRYGFENFRLKIKEEDYFRSRRSEPWRGKLKSLDKEIYMRLRNLREEHGIESVPRKDVYPEADPRKVEESIERLNRYGYVLQMKNGSIIKIVMSDDPESLS